MRIAATVPYVLAAGLFLACGAPSAPPDAGDAPNDAGSDAGTDECATFTYTEVSVPLRDGKSLAGFIHVPVNPSCKLPVIVIQTPYDKNGTRGLWFDAPTAQPLFDSHDYAFLVVDWRGFFGSASAAVPGTQPYGADGYDVIEWAATQPWSTGAVGTWGVSALCQQQYRTAVLKPPHLKAAVPIFCSGNSTYSEFYPGGVLRREFYAFVGPYFGLSAALNAPYENLAWAVSANLNHLENVEAPMLVVAGWYDNFPNGSFDTFSKLVASSPAAAKMRLLVGPWIHFAVGGESTMGRTLDAEEKQYIDEAKRIQRDSLEFFDLHLRGRTSAAASWPAVRMLTRGSTEVSAPAWPPTSTAKTWYFSADGTLATASPTDGGVTFTYDPASPSPTQGGGTLLGALHHGPTSQGLVLAKGDALPFITGPLLQPLTISGVLHVVLDVSTTGVDTDVAIRLTDVDAAGTHLLLADGIRRLKLRASYSSPSLVTPGTRVSLDIPLTSPLTYTFAAGHRVGVIVSGSNFPRFDRNPNTGADFVPDAGSPVQVVTTHVFTDGTSRLVLPVQ